MKRRIIAPLIAALTLCSCGNNQIDVKEEYKDYLDYAFDGQYTMSDSFDREYSPEDNTGIVERVWLVDYTDINGAEQEAELSTTLINDEDKDFLKSQYDWAVLDFVLTRCNEAVEQELVDKLISPYFEVEKQDRIWTYSGDGFTIYMEIVNCALFDPDQETLDAMLDPKSGVKYTDVNLKDWAQDKYNSLKVRIVLEDGDRTEEFIQKLTDFGTDYVEFIADPQNYCFELHAPDSNGEIQLMAAGCKVLGKDADATLYDMPYIREQLGLLG